MIVFCVFVGALQASCFCAQQCTGPGHARYYRGCHSVVAAAASGFVAGLFAAVAVALVAGLTLKASDSVSREARHRTSAVEICSGLSDLDARRQLFACVDRYG